MELPPLHPPVPAVLFASPPPWAIESHFLITTICFGLGAILAQRGPLSRLRFVSGIVIAVLVALVSGSATPAVPALAVIGGAIAGFIAYRPLVSSKRRDRTDGLP